MIKTEIILWMMLTAILFRITGCTKLDSFAPPSTVEQSTMSANTATSTNSPVSAPAQPSMPVSEPSSIPSPTSIVPQPMSAEETASIQTPGPDEVWIWGQEYWPSVLTVPAGTTVTWTSKQGDSHDVCSVDNLFHFSDIPKGLSYNFTFDTPGTYPYYCGCSAMEGVIIVK